MELDAGADRNRQGEVPAKEYENRQSRQKRRRHRCSHEGGAELGVDVDVDVGSDLGGAGRGYLRRLGSHRSRSDIVEGGSIIEGEGREHVVGPIVEWARRGSAGAEVGAVRYVEQHRASLSNVSL